MTPQVFLFSKECINDLLLLKEYMDRMTTDDWLALKRNYLNFDSPVTKAPGQSVFGYRKEDEEHIFTISFRENTTTDSYRKSNYFFQIVDSKSNLVLIIPMFINLRNMFGFVLVLSNLKKVFWKAILNSYDFLHVKNYKDTDVDHIPSLPVSINYKDFLKQLDCWKLTFGVDYVRTKF